LNTIILFQYYQHEYSQNIFDDPCISIKVIRYLICKLYPELSCKINAKQIEFYDAILTNNETYTYPTLYTDRIRFERNLQYNEVIQKLMEGVIMPHNPHNKHTARFNTSKKQRNKIFSIESGENTLDIICLTNFYSREHGIKIKKGDSLFHFFINLIKKCGIN
jgi:hypothetical protein